MLIVVIPTLNVQQTLPALLASMGGLRADMRLIISDGGSQDETLDMAAKAGAIICSGAQSRGGQLARGADWAFAYDTAPNHAGLANSDHHYLFLHADCRLPDNWYEIVQDFIAAYPQKTGYFRYKSCQKSVSGWILKRWVDLRCWAWRLPYGDQGLLIAADLYQELGGYQPSFPLFEDVEFVDRIRKRAGRKGFGPLPATMQTDISDHLCEGVWRRGWRNFRLLRAYRRGVSVDTLYARYHRKF